MRLMGAANRDIAYCPFAPSVVPFGSSQFQEWPLFARCCGLCEIDVGDNQLFLVVGLADDVAVRVHHHRLATFVTFSTAFWVYLACAVIMPRKSDVYPGY